MTLRVKGTYSVSAAENPSRLLSVKPITCNVIFLDDKSENFKLDKNARGQDLINLVFDFLELLERDFFGLQFNDFSCNPAPLLRWLEPTKTLKKQLKGASAHTLWLRVKFYIPDPLWLQEEFTRYLVYLQVRKDVLNGLLVAPSSVLVKMAGLCLQSELGDYSSEDCKQGYVNHIRLIPNQTPDFETEASEAHKSFRSYVPATAELEYLQIARRLELYGIHPEGVTDRNRTKLNIGVSFQGISVLLEMKRIYLYTWDNVEKIVFSGKTFSVSLKHRPRPVKLLKSDPAFETSIIAPANKKALNPTFYFDTAKRAKVFWQYAVNCHTFFRVKEPSSASSNSALTSNAINGGLQPPPISLTSSLSPSASSSSGFSRFFFRGSRSRRSMSVGSGGGGLERTMSTLMALRRRSKSIERGFFRGVSRRFSRRRSFAHSGRTHSVNILNAYESRDSLGMQSIPSLLDESQTQKNASTDLESPTTLDENTDPSLKKSVDEQNKSDQPFTSRKFRASAPALARKQEYLPSHALNLDSNTNSTNADNLIASSLNQKARHASPIIVSLNGKHTDLSIPPGNTNEPLTPDLNCRKKKDSNPIAVSVINREDGVLPRPTTFYNDQTNEHPDGEAKLSLRTRLSLTSKVDVEKAPSINRSLENYESMVSCIFY
nr:tyrosine protein phosphatase non receptor type [Hymenolepis microstoma]